MSVRSLLNPRGHTPRLCLCAKGASPADSTHLPLESALSPVAPPDCLAALKYIRAITAFAMKVIWCFPLAFVADVHGFLFFFPYLALFLATAHVLRSRRLMRVPG